MKKLLPILFLSIAGIVFGQSSGIEFTKGTWVDVKRIANESNKPIFVFGHTPWCHPCREMEATVFLDQKVSAYYNAIFINYSLNFEEGDGLEMAKLYAIDAYPTYLYFDKRGELLHISGSGKPADDFIQDGKNAFDANKAYVVLKEQYDKGGRSPELLYNFIDALTSVTVSDNLLDKVTGEYLQAQPAETISSEKNMRLVFKQTFFDIDAPAVKYYFKYQKSFIKLFGEEEVNKKNFGIVRLSAESAGGKNDTTRMRQIRRLIKSIGQKDNAQLKAFAEIKFLLGNFLNDKKKWKPYAEAVLSYSHKYAVKDNFTMREAATYLNYYTKGHESLQMAMQIIDRAIAAKKSYDNIITQAKLFHNLSDDKKALSAANDAIEIAATNSEDSDDAKELIKEINKR